MAYPYRGPQSPQGESQYGAFTNNPLSPQRNPNRLSGGMSNGNDVRGGLTRRFTTNALPTLSPIGQQRRQAAGESQYSSGLQSRPAPSERRIRHIEGLLEQQRRIAAELEQVDDQTRRDIEETLRHERSVNQMMAQSEPTTPPEYQDAFANKVTTRPNRYSTTSLASPSAGVVRPYTATTSSNIPSQSVPGSRRHSDDEDELDDFIFYEPNPHRAAANPNRNSMPVTSYDRKRNAADLFNTTSFLFDDEDKPSALPTKSANQTSPPENKIHLQVQHTPDGFPKLIRRDNGEVVSGSSAALDLALSNAEQQVPERTTGTRHRISLPPSALSSNGNIAPLNSILANSTDKSAANNRRSMEVKFTAETKRPALMATPPRGMPNGGSSKALVSYSTNDIPTLKSINSENSGGVPVNSPPTQLINPSDPASPEQGSTSTYTRGSSTSTASTKRQSQDYANAVNSIDTNQNGFGPSQLHLQGNGTSFGANMHPQDGNQLRSYQAQNMSPYAQPSYYNGYQGMQMLNNGFQGMNIGGGYGAQGQWPNQMQGYAQAGFNNYQQYPQNGHAGAGANRYADQRTIAQNRKASADEFYNSVSVSDLIGQIYGLCKDQHGCRFLQRKLEERREQDVEVIFNEVKDHFQELMIDPFGNYLCQRLLEYANDEQRTALVLNAAPGMTKIALNQHGTRALQRMIEFISTPEQINLIIEALRDDVVQLIQDLNGNHVIQKCLNHLTSQDAQFIFDAVGANCVIVGQHRHGCCVLQRCVDHASGLQKGAMVDQIIANAHALVQDPFGNYVVQYILDLAEPCFTEPLCRSFGGAVAQLSKQKFSSNVIEKCIRCAGKEVKRSLILEITPPYELEKLLRDSFANYVVQTAMEFADDETKALLIENIRPMVPAIRNTPHGRRIVGKIQDYDNGNVDIPGIKLPNTTPPVANNMSAMPLINGPPSGRANRMGMIGAPPQWSNSGGFPASGAHGFAGGADINAPAPQRNQAFNLLNGNQVYPNTGYGGQDFLGMGRTAPYGHF